MRDSSQPPFFCVSGREVAQGLGQLLEAVPIEVHLARATFGRSSHGCRLVVPATWPHTRGYLWTGAAHGLLETGGGGGALLPAGWCPSPSPSPFHRRRRHPDPTRTQARVLSSYPHSPSGRGGPSSSGPRQAQAKVPSPTVSNGAAVYDHLVGERRRQAPFRTSLRRWVGG